MQVESAILARYAEPMPDGTMTLVGAGVAAFAVGAGGEAPPQPVTFAVFVRVLYARAEMHLPHSIRINVAGPDGEDVISGPLLGVATPDNALIPQGGMLPVAVVAVNSFVPQTGGQYGAYVVVDGDTKAQLAFQVAIQPRTA